MRTFTFKGGIHPPDKKSMTNQIAITAAAAGKVLVFPTAQHIGSPLTPCVLEGGHVFMFQKLADSESFMSAPIHSSVSGIVSAIEPRLHPNGDMVLSIIIENDGLDTPCLDITPNDPDTMSKKDIIAAIRSAGLVGLGGAAFPTHVKLSPPPNKRIDYLIVNGAECEPYITADHRVMLESPAAILDGLTITMKLFDLDHAYIGIEANKKDAISVMSEAAKAYPGISVCVLKTKYPQGAEKQLIKAINGREVPAGGLPYDIGTIVINIETAFAISRAVRHGLPLVDRVVTVNGSSVSRPANLLVRLGTSLSELFLEAGGFSEPPAKILMGGPMMGIPQLSTDVPVIKETTAILALNENDAKIPEESNCIRCGRCVDVCPVNLMPNFINLYAIKYDFMACDSYNVTDCIECGSCTYICPARRHLAQSIKLAKAAVLAAKKK